MIGALLTRLSPKLIGVVGFGAVLIGLLFGIVYYKNQAEERLEKITTLQFNIDSQKKVNGNLLNELENSKKDLQGILEVSKKFEEQARLSEIKVQHLSSRIKSLVNDLKNSESRVEAMKSLNSEYLRILTCIEAATGKKGVVCEK